METKGLNNKSFQSIICIIDERLNTLIPEALYQPEDNEKYLGFGFTLPSDYVMMTDHLPCKAVNLYAMPQNLQSRILAKWPNAEITHSTSVFINSVPKTEDPTAFVNVRNRDFDLVIIKQGRLYFFNNFKFNTKDDFAYFLVFALEQNGLSGQDTPVCFTGLIRPASEIIDLSGRYIRDIRFVEDPNELQISHDIKEVPYQFYHIHYQAIK